MNVNRPLAKYQRLKYPTNPFSVRASILLRDLDISTPIKIAEIDQPPLPPWQRTKIEFLEELRYLNKESTSATEYSKKFSELRATHVNWDFVYTDGSKDESNTGCAYVHNDLCKQFLLPNQFSIFSAELFAILQALQYINNSNLYNIVIATDSLSSIQAIIGPDTKNITAVNARNAIEQIIANGKQIKMMWIPGHCGIAGNEKADSAAKTALLLPNEDMFDAAIPLNDLICLCKRIIQSNWATEWRCVTNNKLREIKESVLPWNEYPDMKRRYRVALCRARIGHTNLTHSYVFNRNLPPECEVCIVPLTVKHILTDCTKYLADREALKLSKNVKVILSNSKHEICKLFEFLSKTKLINEL